MKPWSEREWEDVSTSPGIRTVKLAMTDEDRRVLGVSVEDLSPDDPVFKKLDARFRWSQVPILGPLLFGGYRVK